MRDGVHIIIGMDEGSLFIEPLIALMSEIQMRNQAGKNNFNQNNENNIKSIMKQRILGIITIIITNLLQEYEDLLQKGENSVATGFFEFLKIKDYIRFITIGCMEHFANIVYDHLNKFRDIFGMLFDKKEMKS
ncbi:hypothetical protein M0811_04657 [Anaeramoeba ignava]|uniref:Uncharacterized protein n=1 Tax=Anaeramoeba ignava TaxID=1746090 RepID=A0A9Q0LUU5_ANAIG|nr:hypothetical protein M0811_04657 [Anaeramoeba ignava]